MSDRFTIDHVWPAYMLTASRDGWEDIADELVNMCREMRCVGADPTTVNIMTEQTLEPRAVTVRMEGRK